MRRPVQPTRENNMEGDKIGGNNIGESSPVAPRAKSRIGPNIYIEFGQQDGGNKIEEWSPGAPDGGAKGAPLVPRLRGCVGWNS